MINIAILASGSGTNAQKIFEHFDNSSEIKVSLVISNKADAFVIQRANNANIPVKVFTKKDFNETDNVIQALKEFNIDWVILAGFLLLVPENLINAYRNRIVNIHPALLPNFGGAGMYGMNVHKAVVESGVKETGITIHYVDEHYDRGDIVFQAACPVLPNDTPEMIAEKIHVLEHKHFPTIIEKLCLGVK